MLYLPEMPNSNKASLNKITPDPVQSSILLYSEGQIIVNIHSALKLGDKLLSLVILFSKIPAFGLFWCLVGCE